MKSIRIEDILVFLKEHDIPYDFIGDEKAELVGFSSLANYREGTFTWIKKQENIPEGCDTRRLRLVVTSHDVVADFANVIRVENSKHAFFSIIEHFYDESPRGAAIGEHTYIGPDVKLGRDVRIGHGCTLDGDITIGDGTIIWHHVTIINRVHIGRNTVIKSGAVIGHDGFGYTEDEQHIKTMIKHFGGVTIGDDVMIGANVCVDRGAIDDTVIESGTKIDNITQVGHNVYLGENVGLAYPCFLGGSARVLKNGYLVGAIVRNQCTVHEGALVGLGSVVTKDVLADTVVFGNPARERGKG